MDGHWTRWGYMGLIDGKYMFFESEGAYVEYYRERSECDGEHGEPA